MRKKNKQLIFYFCVFIFMVSAIYLILQLGSKNLKNVNNTCNENNIDYYENIQNVMQNNPSQIAVDMNSITACQGRKIYYKSASDMSPEVGCALNLSAYETENYSKGPLFGRTANLEGDMVQDAYCCYDDSVNLDNINTSYNDKDKEKIASFRDYPK